MTGDRDHEANALYVERQNLANTQYAEMEARESEVSTREQEIGEQEEAVKRNEEEY